MGMGRDLLLSCRHFPPSTPPLTHLRVPHHPLLVVPPPGVGAQAQLKQQRAVVGHCIAVGSLRHAQGAMVAGTMGGGLAGGRTAAEQMCTANQQRQ